MWYSPIHSSSSRMWLRFIILCYFVFFFNFPFLLFLVSIYPTAVCDAAGFVYSGRVDRKPRENYHNARGVPCGVDRLWDMRTALDRVETQTSGDPARVRVGKERRTSVNANRCGYLWPWVSEGFNSRTRCADTATEIVTVYNALLQFLSLYQR